LFALPENALRNSLQISFGVKVWFLRYENNSLLGRRFIVPFISINEWIRLASDGFLSDTILSIAVAKLPDNMAKASVGVMVLCVLMSGVSESGLALVLVAAFFGGGVVLLSLLPMSESLLSLPEGLPGGLRDLFWPSLLRVEYPVVGFRDGLVCLSDSVTFLGTFLVSFCLSLSRLFVILFTIFFPVRSMSSCSSSSD